MMYHYFSVTPVETKLDSWFGNNDVKWAITVKQNGKSNPGPGVTEMRKPGFSRKPAKTWRKPAKTYENLRKPIETTRWQE